MNSSAYGSTNDGQSLLLPPGFEILEPYAAFWAAATTAARAHRRLQSSEAERLAFFNVTKDVYQNAIAQLDRKPLSQLDEQEQRLMNLLLSFAHVALAVEVQGDDEAKQAANRKHMKIVRSSADVAP
jgi:hypothetical protein